jgi:branched-chain amino acid transport system permease protein
VLGGVGQLYGGLIGAPVYMLVHHIASQWNPYHWMFIIGGLLVAVVIFARGGILGMADAFGRWIAQRRGAAG